MDPWSDEDVDNDELMQRDVKWTNISESFTTAGYREGITAGKESAIQEGFDGAFADIGVPLGRELGRLRGIAAVLAALDGDDEAKSVAGQLSRVRFVDICPRDEEAERHAREHLEGDGDEEDEFDVEEQNEEIKAKRGIERLEDMMARMNNGDGAGDVEVRPTVEDVKVMKSQLVRICNRMGLPAEIVDV